VKRVGKRTVPLPATARSGHGRTIYVPTLGEWVLQAISLSFRWEGESTDALSSVLDRYFIAMLKGCLPALTCKVIPDVSGLLYRGEISTGLLAGSELKGFAAWLSTAT
jgi:hypothetical protein